MRSSLTAVLVVLALPAWAAVPTIRWDQAESYDGKPVVVEGHVMAVACGARRCTLAFDPMSKRFAVVVKANRFNVFPPADLKRVYTGRLVRATGTVRVVAGRPEMAVRSADDLELVEAPKPVAEEKPKDDDQDREERAAQHEELMSRLDDVLDRVQGLDERIGALEQRLDVVLAQLDQQQNQLAALDVEPPPPAPETPTWGEPQARPAYEALRTLKRGMSSAQVERLVGPPLRVQTSGGGWVIWDYGYGRSISFDQRGRAASLVGFPKP
jgi:hypothetical protein